MVVSMALYSVDNLVDYSEQLKDTDSALQWEPRSVEIQAELTALQMADYWADKKVESMALYSVDNLVDYSV